jgi:squalene cyclase
MFDRSVLSRAADFLQQQQAPDGHWEDFALPVGKSDAWVTAYAGLALADWDHLGGDPKADDASRRAAAWLTRDRPYPTGWGFNGTTGPDADSTAHAVLLLGRFGQRLPAEVAWLFDLWRPEGGFATFPRDDAWGRAHPCVTPVAFMALDPPRQRELQSAYRAYVTSLRTDRGTWPSYWWQTTHYSTFVNLLALRHLGDTLRPAPPRAEPNGPLALQSAFTCLHRCNRHPRAG